MKVSFSGLHRQFRLVQERTKVRLSSVLLAQTQKSHNFIIFMVSLTDTESQKKSKKKADALQN